jgi:hypothetical protein
MGRALARSRLADRRRVPGAVYWFAPMRAAIRDAEASVTGRALLTLAADIATAIAR